MVKLTPRSVHLDFHTSPDIKDIGKNFTKEKFQAAIKAGHLSSITVFAKCHHGLCYYPTEVDVMHPNLDFDLTGAMIDAAHEIGVKAPVYIPAGWSDRDAIEHPEWVARNYDGTMQLKSYDIEAAPDESKPYCSWHDLCLNDGNPYTEHIYKLTEEICKRYKEFDGMFVDICCVNDSCYCEYCKKGMKEMGLDPTNEEDGRKYYIIKRQAFMQKCNDAVHKYHPNASVFFNSGGADQYNTQYHDYQTHYEMEDLPTGWGGYDKLPIRAKFFSKTGKDYCGQTGKFHLDWGEFGGFKAKEAIKFEAVSMALYGAKCCVGDQLHPDGEPEMQTYENIGYAFEYLEKIEPYCFGGKSTANLGLYVSEDRNAAAADEGLSKILLENQLDFDIVYKNDFTGFDTVIFSDKASLDEEGEAAVKEFIANGGKVLFTGNALVKNGKFILDCGLEYKGESQFDCDYILAGDKLEGDIPRAPMLAYIPGSVTENKDAEVLGEILTPYFSRTYGHFCSHKNTPFDKETPRYPAAAVKGNVAYVAHPVSTFYKDIGSTFHKNYFISVLRKIYNAEKFSIDLMSQGRCTMIKQEDKNRYCLNMVYASPIKRNCAEVIEDIVPLYNIPVTLHIDEEVKRIYSPISGKDFEFTKTENGYSFTVDKIDCHNVVVIDY